MENFIHRKQVHVDKFGEKQDRKQLKSCPELQALKLSTIEHKIGAQVKGYKETTFQDCNFLIKKDKKDFSTDLAKDCNQYHRS